MSLDHTYEPETGAWYFDSGSAGDVCHTQTLEGVTVNIDWGHGGAVMGVEVLGSVQTPPDLETTDGD